MFPAGCKSPDASWKCPTNYYCTNKGSTAHERWRKCPELQFELGIRCRSCAPKYLGLSWAPTDLVPGNMVALSFRGKEICPWHFLEERKRREPETVSSLIWMNLPVTRQSQFRHRCVAKWFVSRLHQHAQSGMGSAAIVAASKNYFFVSIWPMQRCVAGVAVHLNRRTTLVICTSASYIACMELCVDTQNSSSCRVKKQETIKTQALTATYTRTKYWRWRYFSLFNWKSHVCCVPRVIFFLHLWAEYSC